MPLIGSGILFFQNDVEPSWEREYNDYYLRQHIIERVCVPGFMSGRRYRSVDGSSLKYFNLYETATPDVLFSLEYEKLTDTPSAWTQRIMPHFRNNVRAFCRIGRSVGVGIGGAAWVLKLSPGADGPDAMRAWLSSRVDAIAPMPEVVAAHWLERFGPKARATNDMKFRQGADRSIEFALVVEANRPEALYFTAATARDASAAGFLEIESSPPYQLLFALPPGQPSALPHLQPNSEFAKHAEHDAHLWPGRQN